MFIIKMIRLIIIACILTFVVAGIIEEYTVCRTEECFKVAAELWESINKSANACEDFYEYACGSWKINNPVPPTKMMWDSNEKTTKLIQDRVRDLLEESVQKDDILPVKQLKKFYRSCMNIDALEIMGVKQLAAILIRNGGWPMAMELEEWDSKEFMWQRIDSYYLKMTGLSAVFDIDITPDYREVSVLDYMMGMEDESLNEKMVLRLMRPKLPIVVSNVHNEINRFEFNRTKMYNDGTYEKFITEVALIFAKERDTVIDKDQIAADVKDMIELEKKLERGYRTQHSETKCIKLEELQALYDNKSNHENSKINWKGTINDYLAIANVELNEDEEICIWPVDFLKDLAKLLGETKPRTLVNYIHWKFLSEFISYTTTEMRKLQYDIRKAVVGVKEETPRSEICVEEIQMNHALAYMYIQKFFNDKMKQDAEQIFSGVQKAMIKHILKADWLSDDMRKIFLQKINKMGRNFGYPEWYNNNTYVTNYYRGMAIGHQFLDNVLSYKILSLKKTLRILRTRTPEDEWTGTDPLMVNAFYNPMINTLTIPAGEFQTVFYSPTLPRIITYGNIGATMGHEVSHGFEIDGIDYNGNGKMAKISYYGIYKYKKRANCYISQFEDFYADKNIKSSNSCSGINYFACLFKDLFGLEENPTRMSAKRTQAENMADSMGVEMVFEALEEMEKEKNSPRFPGFEDMTNEQFFFVSYANTWCESSTPEYKDVVENYADVHSEARYRVIATLQNSEEFAKAYKCPIGSPMNPEKKCKIW